MKTSLIEKAMKKVAKRHDYLPILECYTVSDGKIYVSDMETIIEYPTRLEDGVYKDFYGKEKTEYTLSDAVAYPKLGEVKGDGEFSISKKNLLLLNDVVNKKCFAPMFTGMYFSPDGNIVGTDIFSLVEVKNCGHKHSFIAPKILLEILYGLDTTYVEYEIYNSYVVMHVCGITIIQALIKGNFPDYKSEKIMPKEEKQDKLFYIEKNLLSKSENFYIKEGSIYLEQEKNTNEKLLGFDDVKITKKQAKMMNGKYVGVKRIDGSPSILYYYTDEVNIVARVCRCNE